MNIFKTEHLPRQARDKHRKGGKRGRCLGEENNPFPIINGRLYALASDVGWDNAHDTGEQGFCLMRRINNASSFGPIFWLVRNEPQKTQRFRITPFPYIRIRSLPRQAQDKYTETKLNFQPQNGGRATPCHQAIAPGGGATTHSTAPWMPPQRRTPPSI